MTTLDAVTVGAPRRTRFTPLAAVSAIGCVERWAGRCVPLREVVLSVAASCTDSRLLTDLPGGLLRQGCVVELETPRGLAVSFPRPGEYAEDGWPRILPARRRAVAGRGMRWGGGGWALEASEGSYGLSLRPEFRAILAEARNLGFVARREVNELPRVAELYRATERLAAARPQPGEERRRLLEMLGELRELVDVSELSVRARLGGIFINRRLTGI